MRRLRAVLIAPGNRADLVAKLPRSGPDAVILDLEDAVAPDAKGDARVATAGASVALAEAHPHLPVYVRVNPVPTSWFADDIAAVVHPALAGIVVPKVESADHLEVVAEALRRAGVPGLEVMAGIETAVGVAHVDAVLGGPATSAYWGAEDFVADMGGVRTADNTEVLYARSRVALAARVHGLWSLDQVVTAYDDDEAFTADARQGRALGFGGKTCIHPRQVPLAREVFSPTADEVAAAERLLKEYEAAAATGVTAIAVDGRMVDEPMARRARAVLAEHMSTDKE